MEHVGVLQSIAEISVALAGFGGLTAGLGYRTRGDWSGDDRVRLFALVIISLSVVFACYLPSVASSLGSLAPWRIASAFFLLVPLSLLCGQAWMGRRGAPAGYSRAAIWLLFGIQVAALAPLSIVALGFASAKAHGLYLSATLLMLFDASVLFVRLLATSFRDGPLAGPSILLPASKLDSRMGVDWRQDETGSFF
jgi:hypothetical protein